MRIRPVVALLIGLPLVLSLGEASAQPVAVRHAEGVVHGFLVLRDLDGAVLAQGDLIQTAQGDRVTSRVVFHFKDGSLHDETAIYSQRQRFRLLSDHVVQKGPAFPIQLDMTIDRATSTVTTRYTEKDGDQKVETEKIELPLDTANGLMSIVTKNFGPEMKELTASMVAATPKPRLVKVTLAPEGEENFSVGGAPRKATRYVVKVHLGGITGLVAPLVGKQPPDSFVWILRGDAPAFLRSEAPLYVGGPMWRIELASPVWSSPNGTP